MTAAIFAKFLLLLVFGSAMFQIGYLRGQAAHICAAETGFHNASQLWGSADEVCALCLNRRNKQWEERRKTRDVKHVS